jgi:hypothetical protein
MVLLAFANKHLLAEGKLELFERSEHSVFSEDGRSGILFRVRRAGTRFRSLRIGLWALACGGLAALVSIVSTQGASAQANPPTLIEIVPASGPAGPAYPLHATIRGTGFMPAATSCDSER